MASIENEHPVVELELQPVLLPEVQLWSRKEKEKEESEEKPAARVKAVQRDQLLLRPVDVEHLLGPDHRARAIWEAVGQRDLQPFYEEIKSVEGNAGRPPYEPRLLISLWLYSYSEGIASGREIEKRCSYDPAYQWLTGAEVICAHTLTDFRAAHEEGLKDFFSQVLAAMAQAGLVDLEQVTQDGTKIGASAGADTFRRKKKIEEHLEQAQKRVEELMAADPEKQTQQALAAQQRGAREKLERLQQALEEVKTLQKDAKEPEKVRVSTTDPEARNMKQSNSGFGPSYNVQLTTDAKQTVIVSVDVTQEGNDAEQLLPAMQRVEEAAGQAPQQAIADGSYINRGNIVAMHNQINLIGPVPDNTARRETLYQIRGVGVEFRPQAFSFDEASNSYTCPAGKTLAYAKKQRRKGQTQYTYQAQVQDCQVCRYQAQCCPKSRSGRSVVRVEDSPEVKAFRTKMETEEAKTIYKKRGAVAEFPHLCIKERFGLRRFSLRGLKKVKIESLWLALTFNIQQWIRLRGKSQAAEMALT